MSGSRWTHPQLRAALSKQGGAKQGGAKQGGAKRRLPSALEPLKAVVPETPGTNKFGAKKQPCGNGHVHDSKGEAKRCDQLHLLQRGGVISDLTVQPQFWFVIDGRPVMHARGRRVGYRADFYYVEGGVEIVEDVKGGYRDDAWTLRKAIFLHLFPTVQLREIAA